MVGDSRHKVVRDKPTCTTHGADAYPAVTDRRKKLSSCLAIGSLTLGSSGHCFVGGHRGPAGHVR